MQKENLAAIEIEVCLVAVEADLNGSLTEIVVGVVAFVAGAIKIGYEIVEELIIFIQLRVFEVITIIKRVGKDSKGAK